MILQKSTMFPVPLMQLSPQSVELALRIELIFSFLLSHNLTFNTVLMFTELQILTNCLQPMIFICLLPISIKISTPKTRYVKIN